jgi:hypothetical protein
MIQNSSKITIQEVEYYVYLGQLSTRQTLKMQKMLIDLLKERKCLIKEIGAYFLKRMIVYNVHQLMIKEELSIL